MKVVVPRGQTARDGHRLLEAMSRATLTYADVCGTVATPPRTSPGFRSATVSRVIGTDPQDFERAKRALAEWRMHERSGVRPFNRPPMEVGETVLMVLPIVAVEVRIACRIVSVVDDVDRFGFSYGTLPLHPESGEEQFLLTRSANGEINFSISVFWKPASLLARLGGPVSQSLQRKFTNRYLDSMQQLTSSDAATLSN